MMRSGDISTLSGRWRSLILAVACLLAILPGIATLPPIDRDEARFAQASRQMLESGDFVDIRFQQESRYKKPVGIYWLQTAAVGLTGQGAEAEIWAYRLVSVAAAVLAVIAIASAGAYLFGPAAGWAAGLMLLGLFGLGFEGRLAKTDAVLLAVTLVAQGALARFYLAPRRGQEPGAGWWWAFWLAIGAGLLVKGPVTPAVSALTVLAVAALDRDRAWLRGLKWGRGIAVALLVCLPWFLAITWRSGGDFWVESFGRDFLGKITSGQESHGAPPGYYVLTYSLYMWPFGLVAIYGGLKALLRFRDPRLLFCLAWYIPLWLVLEVTPTKLPHYPLPAYPALLLLGAWALFGAEAQDIELRRWQKVVLVLAAVALAALTIAFAGASILGAPVLMGRVNWFGLPAAALALLAGWLASGWGRPRMGLPRIAGAAVASALFIGLLAGRLMPSLEPMWLSPAIAEAYRTHRPCQNSPLAAVGFHEPSLVFLTDTSTRLTGLAGAVGTLEAEDRCGIAVLPVDMWADVESRLPVGQRLESVATISGTNYSNGNELELVLLRRAD